MNGKPSLPRKLIICGLAMNILKDIDPTETGKLVCIAVVAVAGMLCQQLLDKGEQNAKGNNLIDPAAGTD